MGTVIGNNCKKRKKTPAEKSAQASRTQLNKQRRIRRELLKAHRAHLRNLANPPVYFTWEEKGTGHEKRRVRVSHLKKIREPRWSKFAKGWDTELKSGNFVVRPTYVPLARSAA